MKWIPKIRGDSWPSLPPSCPCTMLCPRLKIKVFYSMECKLWKRMFVAFKRHSYLTWSYQPRTNQISKKWGQGNFTLNLRIKTVICRVKIMHIKITGVWGIAKSKQQPIISDVATKPTYLSYACNLLSTIRRAGNNDICQCSYRIHP